MTRTTPELAPPSPSFRATPTGGRLATTYGVACNRPHTRRIFSGIGFRTCDPPVPRENSSFDKLREVTRAKWLHQSLDLVIPMFRTIKYLRKRRPETSGADVPEEAIVIRCGRRMN
ncbi:hypothetical protein AVEN_114486-1, partial [Araneus ventricosus]